MSAHSDEKLDELRRVFEVFDDPRALLLSKIAEAWLAERKAAREVDADHKRLVRELDVALNGEAGAAKQASLCDIVAQIKRRSRIARDGVTEEVVKAMQQGWNDKYESGGSVDQCWKAAALAVAPLLRGESGEAKPVAFCDPSDPFNGSAFAWPGTDRDLTKHTDPLYTVPQSGELAASDIQEAEELADEFHQVYGAVANHLTSDEACTMDSVLEVLHARYMAPRPAEDAGK